VVEQADWSAVDKLLALRDITPATVPAEEFMARRREFAHGNSGLPIIGDPDHVTRMLVDLSRAGLTGIAVSLVNFADELPYLCTEVLPRLVRAGLRLPVPPSP
jgi:alkanesulfonate monooxygenase SsuD/methylene tetrahydromethanopterin reductase-like flavin-dependent oxidoreductase (luciferase family)